MPGAADIKQLNDALNRDYHQGLCRKLVLLLSTYIVAKAFMTVSICGHVSMHVYTFVMFI